MMMSLVDTHGSIFHSASNIVFPEISKVATQVVQKPTPIYNFIRVMLDQKTNALQEMG